MQYAINIADMTKDNIIKSFLVLPVCPNKRVINVDKDRIDEMAVILECDEDRAKAIIDVIRIKHSKNLFRCYESKSGKSWVKI